MAALILAEQNSLGDRLNIEQIPVVRKFIYVFLEKITGLPLNREVELASELMSGTTPISKYPYIMTLKE